MQSAGIVAGPFVAGGWLQLCEQKCRNVQNNLQALRFPFKVPLILILFPFFPCGTLVGLPLFSKLRSLCATGLGFFI